MTNPIYKDWTTSGFGPAPAGFTHNGARVPKVAPSLRKNVAWMLRNEHMVLLGWCSLHRPGANPADFHVRLARSMKELFICPPNAEDPDELVGPYGWDDAKVFAAKGRTLQALAETLRDMTS